MTDNPLIYRDIFYLDGSLRDVYIRETSEQDWQTMLDFLRTSSYSLECIVGGERQPLPDHVANLFRLDAEVGITLCVDREHLALNCHCFTREEIEFDLDPNDFQNDQQISLLLDLILAIGRLLYKTVDLTPENAAGIPLFRFDPVTNQETWFLEGR